AWAVGLGGTIVQTADGGKTWELQDSGTSTILMDVCFVDESHGWAVGMDGVIIHTVDGGKTWLAQESGAKHEFDAVRFVDERTGFIVGQESIFLRTVDGGKTWQKEILIDRDKWFYSLFMLDAKSGYACGKDGILVCLP
nr:glycosyl hydrolase [Bacillota bacterium]